MQISHRLHSLYTTVMLSAFGIFTAGCSNTNSHLGKVVFTMIPQNRIDEAQLKTADYLYAPGMKIAVINPNQNDEPTILTDGFYSARAPEISYDGNTLAFSGQKNEEDVWQIWTLDIEENTFARITDSEANCTDPTWLPDGKIAYSKQTDDFGTKHHAIFSCLPDGSDETQITFHPHDDLNASVLKDGRLLISSRQVYPEKGRQKLLAVHPDGTKAELFYELPDGAEGIGKAWEAPDNRIYFTQSNRPVSVDFNRPLHSMQPLPAGVSDTFLSVFPMANDQMLFAAKSTEGQTAGLFTSNLNDRETSPLFSNPNFDLLEALEIKERSVPKKLPSTVNTEKKTGYFICLDVDRTDLDTLRIKTSKILVSGTEAVLGEIPVADDGSFYVEVNADRPIRFESLDENGEPIREPSDWFWVRPDERRGCVGCHEDREYAPSNAVPQAIRDEPFSLVN